MAQVAVRAGRHAGIDLAQCVAMEAAKVVAFLLSDEASHVAAQTLAVDGGPPGVPRIV